jgi:hypothetical protein
MDMSFSWPHWTRAGDGSQIKRPDPEPWRQPVEELVLQTASYDRLQRDGIIDGPIQYRRHQTDPRRLLFRSLVDDPEYRAEFARLVTDTFNHRLTRAYFADLLEEFAVLEEAPGRFGPLDLQEFLDKRPAHVRRALGRLLGQGRQHGVSVVGKNRARFVIDGYPHVGNYTGRYYSSQTVSLKLADDERRRLVHWLVNGEPVRQNEITLPVTSSLRIEPVFGR